MALLLVADAQLYRLESVVRWLDAAQARLRMLRDPAAPAADTTGPLPGPEPLLSPAGGTEQPGEASRARGAGGLNGAGG